MVCKSAAHWPRRGIAPILSVLTQKRDNRQINPCALGANRSIFYSAMDCRPACAACCIAPSISSPIPGMPHGKPAGVPCVQLDDDLRCRIFGQAQRPAVCASLSPSPGMCGTSRTQALRYLSQLEIATAPMHSETARLVVK